MDDDEFTSAALTRKVDCSTAISPEVLAILTAGLAATHAGLCLCDEADRIRYVNPTFRHAFFPGADLGDDFVDALAKAISAGIGIKLESMTLDDFVPRVKARRRSGPERHDFNVDFQDGSWWWVNDRRLPNGWIIVVATEITRTKREELRLREAHLCALKASETDFLTGLSNRRSGMKSAEGALEDFRRSGAPLAVALVDVDDFKSVNDIYGHDVGDQMLVHLATHFANCLGPGHQVSRFGGEEFLIVMRETTATEGAAVLHSLARKSRPLIFRAGQPAIERTFSAGVAAALSGDSLKCLVGRADEALYRAKVSGRGRVEIQRPVLSAA